MMRGLAGLAAALAVVLGSAGAKAAPVDAGHLTAELVAQTEGVAPGQTVWLAVRQKLEKGWHTYWRNPGDAGEPTRLAWSLPAGWKAGDIVWPAPHRLPVGPLMDYGYEGEVLLPVPVTAPATARPGETVPVKVAASFLVCAETCVPEDAVLTLDLPVVAGTPSIGPKGGAPGYDFTKGTAPKGLAGVLVADGKAYELAAAPGVAPPGASGLGPPPAKAGATGLSLAPAVLFAVLGGLLLNLMPCVFPVLAMK